MLKSIWIQRVERREANLTIERKKATTGSRPNKFCTHFRNQKESKSIKYNSYTCFSLIINLIWS